MRPGTGGSLASSASSNGSPFATEAAQHAEGIRDVEAPEDRFDGGIDVAPGDDRVVHRHVARRKAVADGAHAPGEPPRQAHAERVVEVEHRAFEPGVSKSRALAAA